jgi:hypothetical protein
MGRLNTKVIILLQLFECKKIINSLNHPQTSLCSRTFILTRKNLLNLQTRKDVYLMTKYKLKWEVSKQDLIKQDLIRPTPVWRFQIVSSVLNDVFRRFRRYKKIFDVSRKFSTFKERLTTFLERFNDIYWSWKNEAVRLKQTFGSVIGKRAGRPWAFEGQEEKARDRQGGLPLEKVPIYN